MPLSIGFDVGGTFTDFTMFNSRTGEWHFLKVRTTPEDRSHACLQGTAALLSQTDAAVQDVVYLVHGSTVVTNTIIERKGAKVALITTKGFRDVLEIRRQVMPHRYDIRVPKPAPLVPRTQRYEVDERTLASGQIETKLDEGQLREVLQWLEDEDIEAIAICFLHAYTNPENERRAYAIAQGTNGWFVSPSHRVLNEFREYERTSTVVANAYVAPPLRRYLDRLENGLSQMGITAPLLVFQSNGGVAPAEQARELPISSMFSGPAAGVIAACTVARQTNVMDFISLDIGGTSCDVALITELKPSLAYEQEVAGWPIRTPRLDIHSVGAGGGSIAWVDSGGLLRVGPQSAGAVPGPASYGSGGTDATVTDAHLALGRIGAASRLGGSLSLDCDRALAAVQRVGAQVNLDAEQTASGILDVVNATMVRAIRLISVEHGHDPRNFSLIAYGGAGPLHACDLAREMHLRQVIVPPRPGVLCALGALVADLRVDGSLTRRLKLAESSAAAVQQAVAEVERELWRSPAVANRPEAQWQPFYSLDMRYVGQSFELPVALTSSEMDGLELEWLANRFDQVHEQAYGFATRAAAKEIVGCRVSLQAPAGLSIDQLPSVSRGEAAPVGRRPVFFKDTGWVRECPVYTRVSLRPGDTLTGPAIIEQMDTTVVVAPGFYLEVDKFSNLVMVATR